MNPEVFRFITIRPPQELKSDDILLFRLESRPSPFTAAIRDNREPAHRDKLREIVASFVRSHEFVDRRNKVDDRLSAYRAALLALPVTHFSQGALGAFNDYSTRNRTRS